MIHSFNNIDEKYFKMAMPIKDEKLTFDAAFYFMVVTVCTVGYGDIKPDTDLARITIGFFIILMIVLVSKQTSELNELMKFNLQYRTPYKGESKNHVVLIGNINQTNLFKFCKEFYHPDHFVKDNIKILIIQDSPPTKDISSLLNNPKYENKLQYMIGDIFKENIMKSAKIDQIKVKNSKKNSKIN